MSTFRFRTCCAGLVAWAAIQAIALGQEEAPVRYDDHRIATVEVAGDSDIEAVEATGAVILNCIHGPGPMRVLANDAQLTVIRRRALPVTVHVQNVQALVEQQRQEGGIAGGDAFDDFFLAYRQYGSASEEGTIVWYLNELVARYPAQTELISFGTTHQGRTIWGIRVTGNLAATDLPGALYFGTEHAREWVTSTAPTYFATRLLENYGVDPNITDLLDHVEFYLVPVMNVDGFLYTWSNNRFWRKNRRFISGSSYGVDLNRNWATGFGGPGSSASPSSETYRGPSAFSEVETQNFRDFYLAHPNIRAHADIHSFSQLILWPYGYTNALPPDQADFQFIGDAMQSAIFGVHGRLYGAGPTFTAIYPASGVSTDWAYEERGALAFAFELRPPGDGSECGGLECFELPAAQIIPNNEEMFPALFILANSSWVRTAPAPSVAVEGARYISVQPPPGFDEVTIRVTSPDYPCLDKYVDAEGHLVDTPVARSSAEWGKVYITGTLIVPNKRYLVRADYGSGQTSATIQTTTMLWGDAVSPIGVRDFADVSATVEVFQDALFPTPIHRVDFRPEAPDGIADFKDISAAVDGFRGLNYPYPGPSCP